MKFARRSESIKESRAVFKRAREDTRTNFHVGATLNKIPQGGMYSYWYFNCVYSSLVVVVFFMYM